MQNQKIQLTQSQKLSFQLQQSIRLLQLSNQELIDEILDMLEENEFLEIENDLKNEPMQDTAGKDDNILENQLLDINLSNVYQDIDEDDVDLEPEDNLKQDIKSSLISQLDDYDLSEQEILIMHCIINNLDENSYLQASIDDIRAQILEDFFVTKDKIQELIEFTKTLEPIGVAAENLQERIILQLKQKDNLSEELLEDALILIENHFDDFLKLNHAKLISRLKISKERIQEVITLLKTLNFDFSNIQSYQEDYKPDLIVSFENNKLTVVLNADIFPKIRVKNFAYKNIKGEVAKNNYKDASWFATSIKNRHLTLLKIAQFIVNYQENFFYKEAKTSLKPLKIADISNAVEMHESTVSRALNDKYLYFNEKMYELKYFLSNSVSSKDISSKQIKNAISELINNENKENPLTDEKISQLLQNQNIMVARRTVAKYREEMQIRDTNFRRKLSYIS